MTWATIGQRPREVTEEQALAAEDVLDAAAEWDAGRLPLDLAKGVGGAVNLRTGLDSPGWTRALAEAYTRGTDDPRRGALLRMLDAILAHPNRVVTRQGVFHRRDIEQHSHGFDMEAVRNRRPEY